MNIFRSQSFVDEFLVPSVVFVYIAGCIGWAGRSYLLTYKTKVLNQHIQGVPIIYNRWFFANYYGVTISKEAWIMKNLKKLRLNSLRDIDKKRDIFVWYWPGKNFMAVEQGFYREIIIDVPLALYKMITSLIWPYRAWNSLVQGKLLLDKFSEEGYIVMRM